MRLTGWRVDGKLPDIPKICSDRRPHTSTGISSCSGSSSSCAQMSAHGQGRDIPPPILALLSLLWWCACRPQKVHWVGEQMVKASNEAVNSFLTIAPEGTRHEVREWKRGFYICQSAGIPIVLAVVDGRHKTVRIGQVFHPTENMEADMKAIQGSFAGIVGINPRRRYITLES